MRSGTALSLFCQLLIAIGALAQLQRNGNVYQTRFQNVTWDHENWILTTTRLDQGHYQSRASIANGYHGIGVASLGPFYEFDTPVNGDNIIGWPLFSRRQTFATVAGFWDSQPTTNGTNFPWLYQYGWDTAISGIPHWGGIIPDLGGNAFLAASTNSSTISNFESSLDMRNGLVSWAFTWSPQGAGPFNVSYQMFAHRLNINQGFVTMNITAARRTNLVVANVLNGDCAVRAAPGEKGVDSGIIFSSVRPNGVANVTAFVYAGMEVSGATVQSVEQATWDRPYVGNNESSVASGLNVTLEAGQLATFTKYVGIASSDGFATPRVVARNAALTARETGYNAALQTHSEEWHSSFPSTSVDEFAFPENGSLPNDEYILESAITAVTNPYYLLQNTVSANALAAAANATLNEQSISVGGLGSDAYAGQVFWDADLWMQPGLVATFPIAGRTITDYRVARYPQAQANIATAHQSSKNETEFSPNAAIFPWTSGRFGNCTATGPCFDYQYHLNGDIGLAFTNYWLSSGDTGYFTDSLFPIYDSVAHMFSDILVRNGSKWSLHNMTDPDEYANHVNDGAFTMAMISNHLTHTNNLRSLLGIAAANDTWEDQAAHVSIGRDQNAGILVEYTGMNGSVTIKQADVILNTFPLSYSLNYTSTDALADLEYYANAQSPDGPAMTYAMFSIIANTISPSGCSGYTYAQYSTHPYIRGPWFQFSEQLLDNAGANGGTHPAYPFLTGHGGANQIALFGYLGLRWLPSDPFTLHIDPSLPPQIPQLRYRTFHFHGHPILASSNQTHTVLTRNASVSPAQGAFPNATLTNLPIPVVVGHASSLDNTTTYALAPNSSLVIPNRQTGHIASIAGNIAQCRPVTSNSDYLPGQFPIGAIDGATSTKWQPASANLTSSITVEVEPGQRVTGMQFQWAESPPYNFSVILHNETLPARILSSSENVTGTEGVVVVSQRARISHPWDEAEALTIARVASNATNWTAPADTAVYTGRYATLRIWGSLINGTEPRDMSGRGATVAEWGIIGEGGAELVTRDEGRLFQKRVDTDVLMRLGHVARAVDQRRRRARMGH